MATALVSIEGVLAATDKLMGMHPIAEGVRLVATLHTGYKILLSSLETNESKVEHWLMLNGLTQQEVYERVVYREHRWIDLDDESLRIAQLLDMRGKGYAPSLIVDTSSAVIAQALHYGFTGLLFANPVYYRPEFRPDWKNAPKPWAEIEEETTRQLELKRTDPLFHEQEDEFK